MNAKDEMDGWVGAESKVGGSTYLLIDIADGDDCKSFIAEVTDFIELHSTNGHSSYANLLTTAHIKSQTTIYFTNHIAFTNKSLFASTVSLDHGASYSTACFIVWIAKSWCPIAL